MSNSNAVGKCEKKYTSIVIETPHDKVEIPLFIARGKKDGPTLLLMAGEHGTELTGPEILRHFIEDVNLEEVAGTIYAFPIVNTPAVRTKQHSFPYDKWVWWNDLNNLNRAWPGNPDGNLCERITYELFENYVRKSNAVLTFHSTNFSHYSEADTTSEESKKLCLDFGRIPHVRFDNVSGKTSFGAPVKIGIPAVLIEWAPLRLVNSGVIQEGVTGIHNVMVSMKMKQGELRKIRDQYVIDWTQRKPLEQVVAVEDGVLSRKKPWGGHVKKGEVIGAVYDLYKYREIQKIISPIDGLLWSTGPNPSHQTTFFMHTDSVCKGECVAEIIPYHEHIVNNGGDAWEHLLYCM